MDLKHLLSVVIAVLTALGGMLFAVGTQNTWLAMALWLAAVVSLVVTDFLGVVRLPRNVSSLLMWGVLAIFFPYFVTQPNWDYKLQSVAGALIGLQLALLFQEKEGRVYGWLGVMSLLQAVVAARYTQGVAFGGLLVVYTIVGIFALALLVLFSPWGRLHGKRKVAPEQAVPPRRWPLSSMETSFTSAPAGSSRSGIVGELFARLSLITVGGLMLAAIIFYTVPRWRPAAWRGGGPKLIATVGFNDRIDLGGLGTTIENPQEVMQLKLLEPDTNQVYRIHDDMGVYLRGTAVSWYSHNHWRRLPPPESAPVENAEDTPDWRSAATIPDDPAYCIGPPVEQRLTMEPYLDRNDLFYIWPLIDTIGTNYHYDAHSGTLQRKPNFRGNPRNGDVFHTSGLLDGHQAEMVPESREVNARSYLQMPEAPWGLTRVKALADSWRHESGLPLTKHYEIARSFEQRLSGSGQFTYSLQGVERDDSIDAIEDFVSNNRRGHCEYFATAMALMLRSQGIPSRVILGYRCDEWHEDEQCYQVRQLHAHAWVEALLSPDQIPPELRGSDRVDWENGGWLRLDPTPAGEIGTKAAERTAWGAWQRRWHSIERFWDKYIVSMDRDTQKKSVYEPISRATRDVFGRIANPGWWRSFAAGLWATLAGTLRSGIMGWLLAVLVLCGVAIVFTAAGTWLVFRLIRLWRRFSGPGGMRPSGTQSSVEFYHRFEQIAARQGLRRAAGQTPREFARLVATQLASTSGRGEFFASALQVVDTYYDVRFGRHALDEAGTRAVERALEKIIEGTKERPNAELGNAPGDQGTARLSPFAPRK